MRCDTADNSIDTVSEPVSRPICSRRRVIITVSVALMAVLVLACTVIGHFVLSDPLVRLARAVMKTSDTSFRVTASHTLYSNGESETDEMYGVFRGDDEDEGFLLYIPERECYRYYRRDCEFILYTEDGSGSLARVESVDMREGFAEALAERDYETLATLLNEHVLEREILDPHGFARCVEEELPDFSDSDYLREHFGYTYSTSDGVLSISFSTDLVSFLELILDIVSDCEDAFADAEVYAGFDSVREYISDRGANFPISLDIEVVDGYVTYVGFRFVFEGLDRELVYDCELYDFDSAELDSDVMSEFETRFSELGDSEHIRFGGYGMPAE